MREIETTKLSTRPFKLMKKIEGHRGWIFDFSCMQINGRTKIVTCSRAKNLRIFDLETLECEKVVKHSSSLFSIHFYKEENLIMTTNYNGELGIWKIIEKENDCNIRLILRLKVAQTNSQLWKITQTSRNIFFCCVEGGRSTGELYCINFIRRNKSFSFNVKRINYPLLRKMETLKCIYSLKSKENTIMFSGGDSYRGVEFSLKMYDYNNNSHSKFPIKHMERVYCINSYFNEKKEEIIISSSSDKNIIFWSLGGEVLNEIKFHSQIYQILTDQNRKNVYFSAFNRPLGYSLYSLKFKNISAIKKKIENVFQNIHKDFVTLLKWIENEDKSSNNNKLFISCSCDKTFNIFELERNQSEFEIKDLKERVNFLRDEEIEKNFKNKMNFLICIKLIRTNLEIKNICKIFFLI